MSMAAMGSNTDFAKTQPLGFDAPAGSATADLTATRISGPLPIALLPQRRDGAVLFTEVRGLISMAGVLEPAQVLSLTSEFCNYVADSVAAAGGEAIGLHHDATLSVFCRGSATNSAQRAIRAAQQIQGGFAAIAERWRQSCGLRTALSQGMHLGEITLGDAGPRGAERRLALGDSVTVGHYILRRARTGEIVMSDSVMGALSVDNLNLDAEPLPQLEIARRQPIRIYGVLLEERLDFT
ncbi:MAG: adenylate/guanylate cyclase domain-containing protein [Betaproteobacteria bacterium]|nr:adenylate/guanylate cyclase domain-containing protein [Betaproteobacteria bacterium]